MITRADKNTLTAKTREIYSDFLTNFDVNPFTGNLARAVNEDAVKQALKNIVLTMCGERFYAPNKGSKVMGSLFELYDLQMLNVALLQLQETCRAYEPRANIINLIMNPGLDANEYSIIIEFTVQHVLDQKFSLNLSVQRIR